MAQSTAPSSPRSQPLAGAVPLGRWVGFEVDVHWSVLVTVGLFAVVLATVSLPEASPGRSGSAYWLTAVVTAVAFVLSLLGHELAHAVVARAHGVAVARVTLWLLGGVTEMGSESPTPRAEALMAGAGPAASILTGLLSLGMSLAVGTGTLPGTALLWLAVVSIGLAVFNLLPGAPLDGGRLLHAGVWAGTQDRERAGLVSTASGRVLGYVLVWFGLVEALLGFVGGLWLALVGWFVLTGAGVERAALLDRHLAGIPAAAVARPAHPAPDWWTVSTLISNPPVDAAVGVAVPVVDIAGRTTGVVTVADLERVPRGQRETTTLSQAASRHPAPLVLDPTADLGDAIEEIRRAGGMAVVEQEGRPVGLVAADDIARAIRLTLLGWHAPAVRR